MINFAKDLWKIFLKEKSILKFIFFVILGLSFSIAVILSTIGLMDGFESSLKIKLKKSMGDLTITKTTGFFKIDDEFNKKLKGFGKIRFFKMIKSEGFAISGSFSKGVLINGTSKKHFIMRRNFLKDKEIIIGIELATFLSLKVGDNIMLALAKGNNKINSAPAIERFKIKRIIDHQIYEKNLRYVYVNLNVLQRLLNVEDKVNALAINIFDPNEDIRVMEVNKIKTMAKNLSNTFVQFKVKPYWYEFATLFEAVKIEKFMISLILQIIVIISIFNVLAFVIFLNEKKAKEIFLVKAMGMKQQTVVRLWQSVVILIWLSACIFSFVFLFIFDFSLANLDILNLPGDIYHLGRINLDIDVFDYLLVFGLSLVWVLFFSWLGLKRINRQTILDGLRREFL